MSYKNNISNDRAGLFSTKGSSSSKKTPSAAASNATAPSKTSSSATYNYSAKNGNNNNNTTANRVPKCMLSSTQIATKKKEAESWRAEANKALQKSFFSSPDPLAAYGYLKKAAECYKSLCDVKKESLIRIAAAECELKNEHFSSAAGEYKRAAECVSNVDEYKESNRLYRLSAESWSNAGEMARAGEALMKGAQELSRGGLTNEASLAFDEVIRTFVPDSLNSFAAFCPRKSNASDEYSPLVNSAFAPEQTQLALKHSVVEAGDIKSALFAAGAICALCEDDADSTVSLWRAYCSVTIIQLAMGDFVAADRTFTSVHLQSSSYLHSNECKLAEDFLIAIKNFDVDALNACKKDRVCNSLDPTLRKLAGDLSIGGMVNLERPVAVAAPPVVQQNKSSSSDVNNDNDNEDEEEEVDLDLEQFEKQMGLEEEEEEDDDELDLR
jgi:tetratricopeptide (TPR) repeat protein